MTGSACPPAPPYPPPLAREGRGQGTGAQERRLCPPYERSQPIGTRSRQNVRDVARRTSRRVAMLHRLLREEPLAIHPCVLPRRFRGEAAQQDRERVEVADIAALAPREGALHQMTLEAPAPLPTLPRKRSL